MRVEVLIPTLQCRAAIAWGFVQRMNEFGFKTRKIIALAEMIEEDFGPDMRRLVMEIYEDGGVRP